MIAKTMTEAVLVALLLTVAAAPAAAGGANLDFEKEFYMPGDVVRAQGSFGWTPIVRILGRSRMVPITPT